MRPTIGNLGLLTGDLAKKPEEAAREIARRDAALAKLQVAMNQRRH